MLPKSLQKALAPWLHRCYFCGWFKTVPVIERKKTRYACRECARIHYKYQMIAARERDKKNHPNPYCKP